jgi:hypothetical protein
MQLARNAICVVTCLSLAACHHATIRTGAVPGDTEIHQKWASSWVAGLVPPPDLETAKDCPNGVAVVETKRSFLNGLVGILTLGIYTPMEIKVRCAVPGEEDQDAAIELQMPEHDAAEDVQETFRRAVDLSLKEGRDVYVQF